MPVILAVRCRDSNLDEPREYLQQCQSLLALPQAVLLDAFAANGYGGTGRSLDWSGLAAQRSQLLGLPVILAGGMTPDNVAQAIAAARPDAVDVASGVERSPGHKDTAKVMAFVAKAAAAFQTRQEFGE